MDQWSMLLHVSSLKRGALGGWPRDSRIGFLFLSPSPWFLLLLLLLYSNPVAASDYIALLLSTLLCSTRALSSPQRPIRLGPRTECAISFQANQEEEEEEDETKFLLLSCYIHYARWHFSPLLLSSVVTMSQQRVITPTQRSVPSLVCVTCASQAHRCYRPKLLALSFSPGGRLFLTIPEACAFAFSWHRSTVVVLVYIRLVIIVLLFPQQTWLSSYRSLYAITFVASSTNSWE